MRSSQKQSEAVRSNQKQSEAVRSNQTLLSDLSPGALLVQTAAKGCGDGVPAAMRRVER